VWYAVVPDEDSDIPDHGFCDAVAWLCARELALALKAEQGYFKMAQQGYSLAFLESNAQSLNEARPGVGLLSANLRAR